VNKGANIKKLNSDSLKGFTIRNTPMNPRIMIKILTKPILSDKIIADKIVMKNGAAKNSAVTVESDNFSKLMKKIKKPKCMSTHLINVSFG
jgi:hypothetical protein